MNVQQRSVYATGIEHVAAYIGEPVSVRFKGIRLLTDALGEVKPEQIGLARLDAFTELHVIVAAFTPWKEDVGGEALSGNGLALVDARLAAQHTQATVSHEVAHSIGFVSARGEISAGHCIDQACLMQAARQSSVDRQALPKSFGDKLFRRPQKYVERFVLPMDFCGKCKEGMWQHGQPNLLAL